MDSLNGKIKELDKAKDEVRQRMELARRQGKQPNQLVELWLAEVDALEHDWGQIQSENRRYWFFNPRASFSIRKRVSERVETAEELLKKVETLRNLIEDERSPQDIELPRPKVLSTEATFKLLKDSVLSGHEGIIGICGMGGVGKTKLLQRLKEEIYSDEENNHFYVVVMIEAPKNCTQEDIQSQIGRELGFEFGETDDKMERKDCIYQYLKGKDFLIVLDDVWENLDLLSIGIPIPSYDSKSKIVVATRSSKVCAMMGVEKRVDVGCLTWRDSWDLFTSEAGKGFILSNHKITKHAMDITRKCGGLPLALRILGKTMASKRTCEEWEEVLKCMDEDPSMVEGMVEVLGRLKCSYDYIKDEELKKCFIHCSIFGDDTPMLKNVLSTSFLSHGVLDIGESLLGAFFKGLDMANELASMCMLEIDKDNSGDDVIKIHKMMYKLALWIASECGQRKGNFLVQAGARHGETFEVEKWSNAEIISLLECNISRLPPSPICENLVSLILANNASLDSIPNGFFENMPSLEVLDLSRTSLKELPSEIGLLANLRILNLRSTKLVSLPEEIGSLGKLEFLNISWVPTLKTIPKDAISKLSSSLRILNLFYGYRYWEVSPSMSRDRLLIEELDNLDRLKILGITVDAQETLARLTSSLKLATVVSYLHLSFLPGIETISFPIGGNMNNVNELVLTSSTELNELVIGGGKEDCLWNLQYLQLLGLTKLRKVIYKLPQATSCLQKLQQLHISSCPQLQELLDSDVNLVIPNLQDLYLGDLRELRSICNDMSCMPALKTLKVKNCPNLRKLPLGMENAKNLKCIRGYKKWWDDLEWEEGDASSFVALFKAFDHVEQQTTREIPEVLATQNEKVIQREVEHQKEDETTQREVEIQKEGKILAAAAEEEEEEEEEEVQKDREIQVELLKKGEDQVDGDNQIEEKLQDEVKLQQNGDMGSERDLQDEVEKLQPNLEEVSSKLAREDGEIQIVRNIQNEVKELQQDEEIQKEGDFQDEVDELQLQDEEVRKEGDLQYNVDEFQEQDGEIQKEGDKDEVKELPEEVEELQVNGEIGKDRDLQDEVKELQEVKEIPKKGHLIDEVDELQASLEEEFPSFMEREVHIQKEGELQDKINELQELDREIQNDGNLQDDGEIQRERALHDEVKVLHKVGEIQKDKHFKEDVDELHASLEEGEIHIQKVGDLQDEVEEQDGSNLNERDLQDEVDLQQNVEVQKERDSQDEVELQQEGDLQDEVVELQQGREFKKEGDLQDDVQLQQQWEIKKADDLHDKVEKLQHAEDYQDEIEELQQEVVGQKEGQDEIEELQASLEEGLPSSKLEQEDSKIQKGDFRIEVEEFQQDGEIKKEDHQDDVEIQQDGVIQKVGDHQGEIEELQQNEDIQIEGNVQDEVELETSLEKDQEDGHVQKGDFGNEEFQQHGEGYHQDDVELQQDKEIQKLGDRGDENELQQDGMIQKEGIQDKEEELHTGSEEVFPSPKPNQDDGEVRKESDFTNEVEEFQQEREIQKEGDVQDEANEQQQN